MLSRALAPVLRGDSRSLLLLGPRRIGKSTLIATLQPQLTLNLARETTFLELASNPAALEERLSARSERVLTVFLDEVQRLPSTKQGPASGAEPASGGGGWPPSGSRGGTGSRGCSGVVRPQAHSMSSSGSGARTAAIIA